MNENAKHYKWTEEVIDSNLVYHRADMGNGKILEITYCQREDDHDTYHMSFKINEEKNFMSGLNNFYILYETLFQSYSSYIKKYQPIKTEMYLDLHSEFGKKAAPIYERLLKRKWNPRMLLLGYTFDGVEIDEVDDMTFTWIKDNP